MEVVDIYSTEGVTFSDNEWNHTHSDELSLKKIYVATQSMFDIVSVNKRFIILEKAYKDMIDNYLQSEEIEFEVRYVGEAYVENFFIQFFIFVDRWTNYWKIHNKKKEIDDIFYGFYKRNDDFVLAKIIRNNIEHQSTIIDCTAYTSDQPQILFWKQSINTEKFDNRKRKVYKSLPEEIEILSLAERMMIIAKEYHKKALKLHNDNDYKSKCVLLEKAKHILDNAGEGRWMIRKTYTDKGDIIVYYLDWTEFEELKFIWNCYCGFDGMMDK